MKKIVSYITVLGIILASCYPEGPEYYEDTDIVFTHYDSDFNFSDYGTYAMPDSIVKITGALADDEVPVFIGEPFNSQILTNIENNMTAFGWQRVDDPGEADLVLFPASWTNTTVYYYYDYWCWYYYYYCGWGYYPYYGSTVSYSTGTLVMGLVVNGNNYVEPYKVWSGAINGLLSGSYNLNRVTNGINQAFAQSRYLKIN